MKKKTRRSSLADFAKGRLSVEDSLRIIDDLEQDPIASEELEAITAMMNLVEERGDEVFGEDQGVARGRVGGLRRAFGSLKEWRLPSPAYVLAIILLILAGVIAASRLTTSPYHDLITVDRMEFESLERGPGAEDFAIAQRRFAAGRYDEAIRILERYTRAMPTSPGVDYAHYFAGAAGLVSARKSILTLFPSYDHDRVNGALEHLEQAVANSTNARIIEESRILRAKGFLMLGRTSLAMDELEKAGELNGPKKDEAAQLLLKIKNP